jgi:phosphatidylinositol alpha-1,6-mannosyltransferase
MPVSIALVTRKLPGVRDFDSRQPFKIMRIILDPLPARFSQLNEYWNLFIMSIYGFLLCLKKKPDIIHCGEIIPTAVAGFILSRIFKIPYLIYCHSEEIGFLKKLKREKRLGLFLLQQAGLILALCEAVKEELVRIGISQDKISKITPGISENYLKPIPAQEILEFKTFKKFDNKKIILTVARLIERKNHQAVIMALKEIIKMIPDVLYVIVGEGPEEDTLRILVKNLGLKDYVRFEGFQSGDLAKYYASCDVFAMPTKQLASGDVEGFGIVFIEAGAFGKPVIGGNVGGSSDSIIDGITGLRVDGEDASEIKKALLSLLTDEEYAKRMGEAAEKRVKKDFLWPARAEEIFRISEKLASDYRRRR